MIQYSGSTPRNDLYVGVASRTQACTDINTSLVAAGWTSETLNAFTVLTLSSNPLNNETVTLAGQVYTFKTVINNANNGEIFIGADSSASLVNFRAAVNLLAGAGTLYSTATTLNASLQVSAPTAATIAFPYTIPGAVSCVVQQITAGLPTGLAVAETLTGGSFSTATVNWSGFKCTSAMTDAGFQCKFVFFNANDGTNTMIRCVAENASETEISNSFAGGETLFNTGASTDIRVIANKYQCFVFPDGSVGNLAASFWCIGVPWIPNFLKGVVITDATNASPIVITTATPHGYATANSVIIRGVVGNYFANVTNNPITVLSTTTFSLDGSTGNGAYTSGGYVGLQGAQIVECVWSQGTSSSGNLIRYQFTSGASFTALNGSTVKDGTGDGALRFGSIINDSRQTSELTWFDGSDLVTEPLLFFGTSSAGVGRLIGQPWDMVIVRKALTRDVHNPPGSIDSHNWWNLTDDNTGHAGMAGSFLHVVP